MSNPTGVSALIQSTQALFLILTLILRGSYNFSCHSRGECSYTKRGELHPSGVGGYTKLQKVTHLGVE